MWYTEVLRPCQLANCGPCSTSAPALPENASLRRRPLFNTRPSTSFNHHKHPCLVPSSPSQHGWDRRRGCQVRAAAAGQQPAQPLEAPGPGHFLFEGRYGLPVVRNYLNYEDLLREIRLEKVHQMMFFSLDEGSELEGPCLVVYKDGRVAQGNVPPYDFRIPYAMETHGVVADRLLQPTAAELAPAAPPSEKLQQLFTNVLPAIALVLVYVATQIAARMKGDLEDRKKIRQQDAEKKRQDALEAEADSLILEAENMANMGQGAGEIMAALRRLNVPFDPADIEDLVAKAQSKTTRETGAGPTYFYNEKAEEQAEFNRAERKKQADAEGQRDEMEEAKEFLKLSTVKVTKALDPQQQKIRLELREAQRKMKGVKLQYTGEDRIFFDDVAGIGDAKVELQEVVDFFVKPELFRASGSKIPKGVLLCGPPGTGKTLLARAVAGESGVAFLSLNASEFVEMFVGVGASRVRDLFNQARRMKPCIIFIDEIDAVGRIRGGARGNDERDQTLNQMLSEMDGFDDESGVIVMAATNRKDVLDPALVRPGRFDRVIYVGLPDFNGRIDILQVHLARRPTADDLNLREIAFETQRYSGAQLANLVNIAANFAGKDGREHITQADLLYALDWERLGPERKPYSDARRRRLAVQEAATALLATLQPAIEPVVKLSIVPREKYPLGQTVLKVNEQRELTHLFTRRYLEEQLLMVLAGRAAEELVYGREGMSTINQRRLVMARRIVQKLTVSSAMSDNPAIGPRTISVPYRRGGKSLKQLVPKRVTSDTQTVADEEMQRLLDGAYQEVREVLVRNRAALDALVEAVMERSTLEGEDVRALVEAHASAIDLERRDLEKAAFL